MTSTRTASGHRRHRRAGRRHHRRVPGRRLASGGPGAPRERLGRLPDGAIAVDADLTWRRTSVRPPTWPPATRTRRCGRPSTWSAVMPAADWSPTPRSRTSRRCWRLNLRPTYLTTAAVLPHLVAAGGGSVVCVSSRAAVAPFPGAAGYVTAKAAVLAFAGAVAVEYRKQGRALQHRAAQRDRHTGEPGRDAGREPRRLGEPGRDRRGGALPRLGRLRPNQRRADPRLRSGLIQAQVRSFSALVYTCSRVPLLRSFSTKLAYSGSDRYASFAAVRNSILSGSYPAARSGGTPPRGRR